MTILLNQQTSLTNNFTADNEYIVFGTITDYSYDFDLYTNSLATSGTVSSMAFWFGNYFDYY